MTRPYHFKKFDFPKGIPLQKSNFLTENPFTQRSESQIREQHNEIEFFRMTF